MKVRVEKGNAATFDCEALVVCHFEKNGRLSGTMERLDTLCSGMIGKLVKDGDFDGKYLQVAVLYTRGAIPAKRILLLGLGERKDLSLEKLRGAFSKAAGKVKELNLQKFAALFEMEGIHLEKYRMVEAAVEGIILGLYKFLAYKTTDRGIAKNPEEFVIIEPQKDAPSDLSAAAERARVISEAVCFVRDLVSTPSNEMTPSVLAYKAGAMNGHRKVSVKVLDKRAIEKLGMHAFLGVAKGSQEPAKFIIMRYDGSLKNNAPIVMVGKGITFDSGGISIKPSDKMDEMKTDMAGGAVVLGVMKAVSELRLPVNLVGLVPATENMPDGKAFKPGDILKSMSGQTIEIISTDAEGRLILADALTYAARFKPAAIVDVATLTGACIIALGEDVIGMMGTDDALKRMIQDAAEETGEKLWELPLWEEYHELIKSDIADVKNAGSRRGGAISAAAFLSRFVGNVPWVHLDIAGPALRSKDRPYIPKGASGIGVRLLVQFLSNWLEEKNKECRVKRVRGKAR